VPVLFGLRLVVARFSGSGGLVSPDVPRAEPVLTAVTISLDATPRQVRAGLVLALQREHGVLRGALRQHRQTE
jgi:hypothetical protein